MSDTHKNLTDDALEQVGRLFRENAELRQERAADECRMAGLIETIGKAAELLDQLAFGGECKGDLDGCHTHGHGVPCPHPAARQFVEAWRAVQAEGSGS